MINLNAGITIAQAEALIAGIRHEKCQNAVNTHFAPNGNLTDKSIYWLYCWAYNGDGSDAARDDARRVWDTIFDIPYNAFDGVVFYPIANARRY